MSEITQRTEYSEQDFLKIDFAIDEREISVHFVRNTLKKGSHWEISFSEKVSEDKYTYKLTGSGNELLVFNTIVSMAVYAFDKCNMDSLIARVKKTDTTKRLSLYYKLALRYFGDNFTKTIDDFGSNYDRCVVVSRILPKE